jgi:hypothetical protein
MVKNRSESNGDNFNVCLNKHWTTFLKARETIAQMIDPLCGGINLGYIYSLSFDFFLCN